MTPSQAIKKFFASDEAYRILDADPSVAGSTWTSGGCWLAARSLAAWMGSAAEIMEIRGRGRRGGPMIGQHVIVQVGRVYVDADGVNFEHKVLNTWTKKELLVGAHIWYFDETEALKDERVPGSDMTARSLIRLLHHTLGDGPLFAASIFRGMRQ